MTDRTTMAAEPIDRWLEALASGLSSPRPRAFASLAAVTGAALVVAVARRGAMHSPSPPPRGWSRSSSRPTPPATRCSSSRSRTRPRTRRSSAILRTTVDQEADRHGSPRGAPRGAGDHDRRSAPDRPASRVPDGDGRRGHPRRRCEHRRRRPERRGVAPRGRRRRDRRHRDQRVRGGRSRPDAPNCRRHAPPSGSAPPRCSAPSRTRSAPRRTPPDGVSRHDLMATGSQGPGGPSSRFGHSCSKMSSTTGVSSVTGRALAREEPDVGVAPVGEAAVSLTFDPRERLVDLTEGRTSTVTVRITQSGSPRPSSTTLRAPTIGIVSSSSASGPSYQERRLVVARFGPSRTSRPSSSAISAVSPNAQAEYGPSIPEASTKDRQKVSIAGERHPAPSGGGRGCRRRRDRSRRRRGSRPPCHRGSARRYGRGSRRRPPRAAAAGTRARGSRARPPSRTRTPTPSAPTGTRWTSASRRDGPRSRRRRTDRVVRAGTATSSRG